MGLAAAPSFGQIKISDALSLEGFIDMSAGYVDDNGTTSAYASFDQFELNFLYTFSNNLSARVDVNAHTGTVNLHRDGTPGTAVDLEQAFLTYTMGSASFMAGKFLSSSGFEGAEPVDLYQYSTSKNFDLYGGYQNGVAVAYTLSPMISLYGAFVGSVWNDWDTDIKKPGIEAQVALTPIEGVTLKAAYLFEKEFAGTYDSAGTELPFTADRSLINVWGMYETGPLTVAAEVNKLMKWDEVEDNGLGYLVMVNYALSDKLGITGRYSALKMDGGTNDNEITVSPGYAISDSWLVLAEVKRELEAKVTSFAVESILTF
jgi:hypothetical protein